MSSVGAMVEIVRTGTRARRTCAAWVLVCGVLSASAAASEGRLVDAVKAGSREAVQTLLEQPGALADADADGTTALHWAVRADDLEMVRLLLQAGADARAATRHGITPLVLAVMNGSLPATEMLLAAGADANAVLPEGETVLMTAARTGQADVLHALLDRGADVHAQEDWHGETALMWAAAENHPAAIEALIDRGADVNGRSALLDVPRRRSGQSVLPLGNWTPILYAARQGALEAVATLAERGADLNATDPDGATPLVIAIINAHYDVAALLLERGADPNITDHEAGMGALYAAVDMHRLAVGHGRPNPKPSGRLGAIDIVEQLLARGADPNARLKAPLMQRHHTAGDRVLGEGATPFMRAAKSGDVAAMRLLLAAGADPLLTQSEGNSAIMFAAGLGWRDGSPAAPSYEQGSEEDAVAAIELCLELGLNINAVNDAGNSVLHGAVSGRGSHAVIRYLVEQGADLQARNAQDRTPLDLAVGDRRDRGDVVALLQELSP